MSRRKGSLENAMNEKLEKDCTCDMPEKLV